MSAPQTMTHDEAWRFVADEVWRIRAPRSQTSMLGDACGGLRIVLGYSNETWSPSLSQSELTDLNEGLQRASTRAMSGFIDAYANELVAFLAVHPEVRRPLPRYLRVLEAEVPA